MKEISQFSYLSTESQIATAPVRRKPLAGESLLQLFGDDIGVRAIDFVVIAHSNGRKR